MIDELAAMPSAHRQEISSATLERLRAFALERSTGGEASWGLGKAGDIV
jgi:hypothetical protein